LRINELKQRAIRRGRTSPEVFFRLRKVRPAELPDALIRAFTLSRCKEGIEGGARRRIHAADSRGPVASGLDAWQVGFEGDPIVIMEISLGVCVVCVAALLGVPFIIFFFAAVNK